MAELIVALDYPEAPPALAMARDLAGEVSWVKVGMELFTACGPDVVKALRDLGFKVFLDLKFHDIPNTVRGAVASAVRAGAGMVNVHASGGDAMLRAARQGVDEAGEDILLIAVTLLTSLSEADSLALYGKKPAEAVIFLAQKAYGNKLDGIVSSAREAAAVKAATSDDFICVTPGIRFRDAAGGDDQARVVAPAEAARAGSDFLVVGRPITAAADPVGAARRAIQEMRGG